MLRQKRWNSLNICGVRAKSLSFYANLFEGAVAREGATAEEKTSTGEELKR